MNTNEIILSFCLNGRNDNYGKDFLRRFQQSMNFLAYNAKKAGVINNIEVVFTDWNSEIPLHEVIELSSDAANLVKFIIVPPEIAKKHNWKDTPFHTTKSANVAIRYSTGKFIAYMPSDILIPEFAIERIIRYLKGEIKSSFDPHETLMAVPRKMIPHNFRDDIYDTVELETKLYFINNDIEEHYIVNGDIGHSGIILYSREMIDRYSGFDENMGGWGFTDWDICLRYGRSSKVLNLGWLGISCYDFEPDLTALREKNKRNNEYLQCNLSTNMNWGLPEEEFVCRKAKVIKTPSSVENKIDYSIEIIKKISDTKYYLRLIKLAQKYSCYDFTPEFSALLQLFPDNGPIRYLDLFSYYINRLFLSNININADLYYYPPLDKKTNSMKAHYFIDIFYNRMIKHLGIIRCVPCPEDGIVSSLHQVFIGPKIEFDIIKISCDYLGLDSFKFFKDNIHNLLSYNGIVIFSGSQDNYNSFINGVLSELNDFTMIRCDLLNIGIFIKTEGKRKLIDDKETQQILARAWTNSFKKRRVYSIALIGGLFTSLHKLIDRFNYGLGICGRYIEFLSHLHFKDWLNFTCYQLKISNKNKKV